MIKKDNMTSVYMGGISLAIMGEIVSLLKKKMQINIFEQKKPVNLLEQAKQ